MSGEPSTSGNEPDNRAFRRRPRYSGKNPRRFEQKYKEHHPERYPETIERIRQSGKTPAGMHVSIMVREILDILEPKPGMLVVDCTLGYGGHALELLRRIQPGGRLIGLDLDPVEQPRTEKRLRALGFDSNTLTVRQSNFAALTKVLAAETWEKADLILADLGVSSMQIDTPDRGFSIKHPGPLDMRMNPHKGEPASVLLSRLKPDELGYLLVDSADEPNAELLAARLAGKQFPSTSDLIAAIRSALSNVAREQQDRSVRRVFQALRIAVNDEFGALEALLRQLPDCLKSGGRISFLTFHSGEDRRVKASFKTGMRNGTYRRVSDDVIRPTTEECHANPRATSAKLRWAERT